MTESPTVNPAMLKLGAVALGGYVLGRMKKGRAAIGLALWAAGVRADPKRMLREGLLNLANSAEGRELLSQLRGPVLEAGRKAAGATLEGQVAALTAALERRTQALTAGTQEATDEDRDDEDRDDEDADDGYDRDEYDESDEDQPEEEPEESRSRSRRSREVPDQRRDGEGSRPRKRAPDATAVPAPSKRAAPQGRSPRRPRKEGAR